MASVYECALGLCRLIWDKVARSETRAKQDPDMTLLPLIHAPLAVQCHVLCAICAIVLGPVALLRRSRDHWHRRAGYAWVIAMFGTATSSFLISETPMVGPFGPIHMLSVFTLYGLWQGVRAARARDVVAHQGHMKNLYFWAMGIAGLFTFLPGRRMNAVFATADPQTVFIVAAIVIGAGLTLLSAVQKRRLI